MDLVYPKGVFPISSAEDCEGPLLVVMHPWHGIDHHQSIPWIISKIRDPFPFPFRTDSYLTNIDLLLSKHKGPVLVLDDLDNLAHTLHKLYKLPASDRYLALTRSGDATPAFCSISELMGFAESFDKELLLSGGYLSKNLDLEKPSGCLDQFCRWAHLNNISSRFVEGCCYTGRL